MATISRLSLSMVMRNSCGIRTIAARKIGSNRCSWPVSANFSSLAMQQSVSLQPANINSDQLFQQKRFLKVERGDIYDPPPPKPTKKEIHERIFKAIKTFDRLPKDKELTLDSHFVNDLGLDSLDHVEIVMALEDEFTFEIPDGDAERLMTPRQIIQYVCDKEDVFE